MNPIVALNQGDGRLGFGMIPLLKREEKELEISKTLDCIYCQR